MVRWEPVILILSGSSGVMIAKNGAKKVVPCPKVARTGFASAAQSVSSDDDDGEDR